MNRRLIGTLPVLLTSFLLIGGAHALASTPSEFGRVLVPPASSEKMEIISESTYVTMRDGVRIAADYIYPRGEKSKYPTVIWLTRYWRSLALRVPSPRGMPINSRGDLPDYFLRNGYAVVFADVRGTGASEGVWTMPFGADERADFSEVLRWISQQSWSNGKLATIGLSYEANTALLAAAGPDKLLSAVIAQQYEYDVYTDIAFPGGIFNDWFIKSWNTANQRLDSNRIAEFFPWLARFLVKGVRPVGTSDDALDALIAKRHNNDVYDSLRALSFRDDIYGKSNVTMDDFSFHTHREAIARSAVPIFSWGSWMDGATANTVLRNYSNLSNSQYAVIGAWDHMTQHQGSPYGEVGGESVPDERHQWGEMLQFVNRHLLGNAAPAAHKKLVYYTMGEEKWKVTETWPPANSSQQVMYLSEGNTLRNALPDAKELFDTYKIDFEATTGTNNRWHTELAKKVDYGNRSKRDRRLLTYTSEPLQTDLEITGHPIVDLFVQSSESDGAFYAYLEDVDADNNVTYVTDGQLRALHRKLSNEKSPEESPTPYRSYKREDAMPLQKNETARLSFALQPTSVLIRQGHRLRLAIAGHDKDTFARIPAAGDPTVRIYRGRLSASRILLPVIKRD